MLYLLGMNMFERVELLLEEKINKLKDKTILVLGVGGVGSCLLYTSPSPRDISGSRMPSSA